jgi:signal recognition particle receptor subunit beta
MLSLATESDRTIFFDFLPLFLGKIKGFNTKFQLYTVPGQVYYNETRKLVLRGVDGVVFIADSQKSKLKETLESYQNLEDNLKEYNIELKSIPLIIQYNKRDLNNTVPVNELNALVNKLNVPWFEAVAVKGKGVFETLKATGKAVINHYNTTFNLGTTGKLKYQKKTGPQISTVEPPKPAASPSAASRPAIQVPPVRKKEAQPAVESSPVSQDIKKNVGPQKPTRPAISRPPGVDDGIHHFASLIKNGRMVTPPVSKKPSSVTESETDTPVPLFSKPAPKPEPLKPASIYDRVVGGPSPSFKKPAPEPPTESKPEPLKPASIYDRIVSSPSPLFKKPTPEPPTESKPEAEKPPSIFERTVSESAPESEAGKPLSILERLKRASAPQPETEKPSSIFERTAPEPAPESEAGKPLSILERLKQESSPKPEDERISLTPEPDENTPSKSQPESPVEEDNNPLYESISLDSGSSPSSENDTDDESEKGNSDNDDDSSERDSENRGWSL